MSSVPNPSALVVTLTTEQLDRVVHAAVTRALEALHAPEPWLSTAELAKVLGMHPKTIARMVRTEDLPAHRLGSEYRFRRAEVEAWLEARAARKVG